MLQEAVGNLLTILTDSMADEIVCHPSTHLTASASQDDVVQVDWKQLSYHRVICLTVVACRSPRTVLGRRAAPKSPARPGRDRSDIP